MLFAVIPGEYNGAYFGVFVDHLNKRGYTGKSYDSVDISNFNEEKDIL